MTKNFSCKVTGIHSGTLLNKVSIINVFLGIIHPFETQQFLKVVAKMQVFILPSVFYQAKIKNEIVVLAESFLHVLSKVRFPKLKQRSSKVA